jgi:uncharacterized protein with HEPN domain
MQPDDADAGYLWDIREAALEVLAFAAAKGFQDLTSDRQFRLSVERDIQTIGEAAGGISDAFRESHPEINWSEMVGQRNVLAHGYGTDIDLRLLWGVVTDDLPPLIAHIDALLPRDQ